jgi:polyhydroxybutyrate depolymerase
VTRVSIKPLFCPCSPISYDGSAAVPLIISLHGYTSSGVEQEQYFTLQPLAEQRGFLYIHPDGTKDASGNQFWNATDACCDLRALGTDDAAYLLSMIEQVQQKYKVDPKRIYIVGHSNGAFMSYRMACDHADKIAAIVSLAGATFADPDRCKPSQSVSVLQVHGTADNVIPFHPVSSISFTPTQSPRACTCPGGVPSRGFSSARRDRPGGTGRYRRALRLTPSRS